MATAARAATANVRNAQRGNRGSTRYQWPRSISSVTAPATAADGEQRVPGEAADDTSTPAEAASNSEASLGEWRTGRRARRTPPPGRRGSSTGGGARGAEHTSHGGGEPDEAPTHDPPPSDERSPGGDTASPHGENHRGEIGDRQASPAR